MKPHFTKLNFALAVGFAVFLGSWYIIRSHAAPAEAKPPKNEWQQDIGYQQLLRARQDTASRMLQMERQRFANGWATLESVLSAAKRLRDDRLELAAQPETVTRAEHLALMRELEDDENKRHGLDEFVAPGQELARYWRVNAEIDLFRAQK